VKQHLNTLFITTQGTYLAKEGECVLIKIDGREKTRIPVHTLGGIVCFGQVSCSPFLLGHCAQSDVAVSFLTERGRFLAAVRGPVSGNVLLRREQYRWADDPERTAAVTRCVLLGKVANCRHVLARAARDHGEKGGGDGLRAAVRRLSDCLERLRGRRLGVDQLRGIEGEAAAVYFGVFDALVTSEDDGFRFRGRNRRPPLDPVNCLLSFLYTLLLHDVRSALECVGLDPAVGFLHRDRPGRPGLALDLMEEFRPVVADRLALSLINRGQLHSADFATSESGAVLLGDEARKTVLVAYQKRKQTEVTHPFLGEKMPLGLVWHTQSLLLARHLRGDLDAYPPYAVK
jgi:CRISPR-associated protein Cas1